MSFFNQKFISENQQIQLPILEEKEIELWIKREDEVHPYVSGNKFRKLKYNLQKAKEEGKTKLLTFGGAFSNHILATAVAAQMEGFESIGVIRGEELGLDLEKTLNQNATLQKAAENGMQFHFVTRSLFREKLEPSFLESLKNKFGDFYLVPEGGTNELAIKGCEEILTNQDAEFDYICSSVGTGGTISGLINYAKSHQKILGFPALKGNFLNKEIQKWSQKSENWELISDYHFGGYAKHSEDLIKFINEFMEQTSIQLDPIYTGKMMYGILDRVEKNHFEKGSIILALHTGGLQGIEGFNKIQKQKNGLLIQ